MRAFVGISLPKEQGLALFKSVKNLRESADIALVRPEKMHITLAFFDDLAQKDIPKIEELLREMFTKPIDVTLSRIGSFDRFNVPSVLFAAVESENLTQSALKFRYKLKENGITFEDNAFKPNLTIARIRSVKDRADFISNVTFTKSKFKPSKFKASNVTLFSSNLVAYKVICNIELIAEVEESPEDGAVNE